MYKIRVYVQHGYYEYSVESSEQAVAHAQAIISSGAYRRSIPGGIEVHKPYKVKAIGEGLESEYPDTFKRT